MTEPFDPVAVLNESMALIERGVEFHCCEDLYRLARDPELWARRDPMVVAVCSCRYLSCPRCWFVHGATYHHSHPPDPAAPYMAVVDPENRSKSSRWSQVSTGIRLVERVHARCRDMGDDPVELTDVAITAMQTMDDWEASNYQARHPGEGVEVSPLPWTQAEAIDWQLRHIG